MIILIKFLNFCKISNLWSCLLTIFGYSAAVEDGDYGSHHHTTSHSILGLANLTNNSGEPRRHSLLDVHLFGSFTNSQGNMSHFLPYSKNYPGDWKNNCFFTKKNISNHHSIRFILKFLHLIRVNSFNGVALI